MKEFLKPFFNYDSQTPLYIRLAGITYPDSDYHISRKKSSVSVIEYILDGEGYINLPNGIHKVEKDTIYILHRGENQDYYSDKNNPYTKIFINVSGELYETLISAYGMSGKHFFTQTKLRATFEEILSVIKSELTDAEKQIKLQSIFIEIISTLSVSMTEKKHSDEALKLKNYLNININRFVSAEELSQLIYRSPDYCQKLFCREFGNTPYAYHLNQKMRKAKMLLVETKMPVSEIAETLGYLDAHYFSNLFYKKCGLRPKDYRKQKTKIVY